MLGDRGIILFPILTTIIFAFLLFSGILNNHIILAMLAFTISALSIGMIIVAFVGAKKAKKHERQRN